MPADGVLDRRHTPIEGGQHRELPAQHAGGDKARLCDSDHRHIHELTSGLETGIAEACNHYSVERLLLLLQCRHYRMPTEQLVVVPVDARHAATRR